MIMMGAHLSLSMVLFSECCVVVMVGGGGEMCLSVWMVEIIAGCW